MQKSRKIGLLILLLAIPIFFILFFELFSTNHYAVPVFYENGIDSLAACKPSQSAHRVKPLLTQNTTNQQTRPHLFTDAVQVVYTPSAKCESACVTMLEELARVQGVLETQAPTQITLIANSGSPSLSLLAQRYKKSQPSWLFLEGSEREYPSFLQCELVLPRFNIPLHETLVLVDRLGQIRGYYRGTDPSEVDRLIAEIRILEYSTDSQEDYSQDRTG
ncbi:SCO family protein [Tunicatimonas pelagia]|uniref:SCO family protein n=1 Tax=Tunicatimonas pelagia TaxID=931531 RepID=UPI0026651EA7|nr:hypothetical protein [Tunicatimonas pelagia]WKN44384.1 hypothetical protein P0M28_05325 [Tunicatimonas pelagia]